MNTYKTHELEKYTTKLSDRANIFINKKNILFFL